MLFEHALLLIGIPLILIVAGIIKNYGALVIAGGVALLVVGVLVLASPVYTQELGNRTIFTAPCLNQTIEYYEYENFTQPEAGKFGAEVVNKTTLYTYDNCTYPPSNQSHYYDEGPLPANDNLLLGVMLAFVGLLCLVAGFLTTKA